MKMFSEQFLEENTFEIEYEGKIVRAFYSFDKIGTYILRFTFIESHSPYRQAIIMHLDNFTGEIFCGEKKVKIPKNRFPQLIFPKKITNKQFELKVVLKAGDIGICNGSAPLGTEEIWHSLSLGCAMIPEVIEKNHYRFYCNDHENDDDFNDLVFDMEVIEI